jgi:hypothetical protein
MNAYSCNGKNIFMRWKIECSIQRGDSRVEWNIASFTEWKYSYHCTNKHSLFVLYNTKITNRFVWEAFWQMRFIENTKSAME